jgi:methionyl-tRNA formyltransferase
LPWNKGADPNFWSWFDATPKGVSIHWMTPSLDKGEIVSQQLIDLDENVTLRESYDYLSESIEDLFKRNIEKIVNGYAPKVEQLPGGSEHKASERLLLWDQFPLGWDTPCHVVSEVGRTTPKEVS